MIYILDANAVSDWMHKHPVFVARVTSVQASDEVIISATVYGEIMYGIIRLPSGKRKESLRVNAMGVIKVLRCEPVTTIVAERYAQLRTDREQRGVRLAENDMWIAATALTLGATLVTRDGDMSRIPGLIVVDWTV